MPPETLNPRTAAFGPYTVDLRSGQLRKHGTRLKLGEQPFRILVLLLEREGELVTREELKADLWAADTFVDFDRSLNSAVQRLRDSLSDTAEKARWVETVPRRGYRFVGSVVWENSSGSSDIPESNSNGNQVAEKLAESIAPEHLQQVTNRFNRARIGVALIGMLILVLVAIAIVRRLRLGHLAEKDTVVLADFANSTGDPVFDDTLKTALSISLRQSPFLNLLPDSEVATTLQLMTRSPDTKLTPEITRELCERAGSKAYIAGAIGSLGSEYVLGLKAVNCQTGDALAQEQVTVASKERVLEAIDSAASQLRRELGESLVTVQKFDVPLAKATTPSLEALKAFSLGVKAAAQAGAAAALPYYQRSTQLDPNFAMGYRWLGGAYLSLGETERCRNSLTKAFQMREHATERERLVITADYYEYVTSELDQAAQALQLEIQSYPQEPSPYGDLSLLYAARGKYEKAVETARQGLQLSPGGWDSYVNLALFNLALQRFDEARRIINQASANKIDSPQLHTFLYALAFVGKDSAAMAEQQLWFAGQPEYEAYGFGLIAETEAYGGHLEKSRDLTKRAVQSALHSRLTESAAIFQAIAAQREAAFGRPVEARRWAAEALKLVPGNQDVQSETALAFAMAGDVHRVESLMQERERSYPQNIQTQSLWLPAIRGQVALSRGNASLALRAMPVSTIEFANIQFANNISCLYHVYVRGQAYLAAGQGTQAANEFQKILDHSGIVWNCWTGALARLGVARANALQAKSLQGHDADVARTHAIAAYRDFLALWKDADPDVPVLKEAKVEYARLQ